MNKAKIKGLVSIAIILLVLIIDQIIKVEVKTNMHLGEKIHITDWFQLLFVENNGMAFGWEIGGKLFLTSFRIIAISAIGYLIYKEIRRERPWGYIVCLALILAGAAGNIFDCLFYGQIFSESTRTAIAEFVPWGTGYSDFMTGKVVDMFYFPLIEWDMPGWLWLNNIPFLPNAYEHCIFFSPIFNFADAAISCGIVALVIFYHKLLSQATVKSSSDSVEAS